MKGIASRIASLNVIYYASVVIKAISICNSMHHNNGHPLYIIVYPECDMTFYALSVSS